MLDGLSVGTEHPLPPGEGGDEHQEGRARQVEVGQQGIDATKSMARTNEQVDGPLPGAGGTTPDASGVA